MNNWIIGRRWNVVQTAPNSESLAATSAKELGWQVFWPRYREKVVRPHRKAMDRVFPYIPGYIFVEAQRWAADGRPLSPWELGKAKGVTSVIKVGDEHALVPDTDAVMRTLLKMADDDGFVKVEVAKKPITLYKKGDKVMTTEGPFAYFAAVVGEISKNHQIAKVWVDIFGRPTPVSVDIRELKPDDRKKIKAAA